MKHLFLIGKNLNHSKSKSIHSFLLNELCLSDVVYENLEVSETNLHSILSSLNSPDVLGANITIPYKEYAANFFNNPNPINTIYKTPNGIQTTSTDFLGFIKTLSGIDLNKFDIFIFGSGGVSKSISSGFASFGVQSKTVSRNGSINYDNFEQFKTKQCLLINATPLGTVGEFENATPTDKISEGDVVYDLVYNPAVTNFMKLGMRKNCRVFNGMDMLIYQAIFSMELFLNKQLNVDASFSVIKRNLK